MTKRQDLRPEAGLDAFFYAAREHPPAMPGDLLSRIEADATALALSRTRPAPPASRLPRWSGVLSGIGGWPALAGLATATVAGFWLGYAAPGIGSDLGASAILGTTEATYDVGGLLPGYVPSDDWSL
jgi:hypothetical protein